MFAERFYGQSWNENWNISPEELRSRPVTRSHVNENAETPAGSLIALGVVLLFFGAVWVIDAPRTTDAIYVIVALFAFCFGLACLGNGLVAKQKAPHLLRRELSLTDSHVEYRATFSGTVKHQWREPIANYGGVLLDTVLFKSGKRARRVWIYHPEFAKSILLTEHSGYDPDDSNGRMYACRIRDAYARVLNLFALDKGPGGVFRCDGRDHLMDREGGPKTSAEEARADRHPVISSVALVVSNLIPLFGALLLGWSLFSIFFIFWLENVVIGIFNVLRMAVTPAGNSFPPNNKAAIIISFVLLYGLAVFVHGAFVVGLFGGPVLKQDPGVVGEHVSFMSFMIRRMFPVGVLVALIGLVIGHAVSYFSDFIGRREYRNTNLDALMGQPFGRVALVHVPLFCTGVLLFKWSMAAPSFGLAVLVILKSAVDLRGHWRERKRFAVDGK
jgi:hypothetical protein